MAKKPANLNPGNYTDHPRKQVFRQNWAKPILQLIHDKLEKKLIYLGLPGIKALDVKAWIEYVEKVIAFQYSDIDGNSTDDEMQELIDLFNQMEASSQISSYQLYQGYIEDVVIGGVDKTGASYKQNDFVTVYNLDFCNTLTSPTTVLDAKGNKIDYYKLDVILKLLELQKQINPAAGDKFIMFLTVNSNFKENEIDEVPKGQLDDYKKKIIKIKKAQVRAVRMLKAYTYHFVSKHFNENGFNVEFMPPIFYQGSQYPNPHKGGKADNHWMLTFTILGTRVEDGENPVFSIQDAGQFLNSKFVFANNNTLSCFTDPDYKDETDFAVDVVEMFKTTNTYANLW